jgi:DNA-binding MarR family transcriptional regulator
LNTVDALVQLSFLIQRILSATGAEHDLSIIQMRLLGVLRDRQAGMLELGGHLGLDKSSMTGLVGRAEKRGLVRRSPSPHDGRAVLVSLTPYGRQLADEGGAEIGRRISELTEHLTSTERTQLTQLAAALLHAQPAAAPGH